MNAKSAALKPLCDALEFSVNLAPRRLRGPAVALAAVLLLAAVTAIASGGDPTVPPIPVGPVVGIWMSMVAFCGTKSGIAAALINTSPIFMIPIAYFAYGEKPTFRSLAGTAAAMAGVFMLLLKAA